MNSVVWYVLKNVSTVSRKVPGQVMEIREFSMFNFRVFFFRCIVLIRKKNVKAVEIFAKRSPS